MREGGCLICPSADSLVQNYRLMPLGASNWSRGEEGIKGREKRKKNNRRLKDDMCVCGSAKLQFTRYTGSNHLIYFIHEGKVLLILQC